MEALFMLSLALYIMGDNHPQKKGRKGKKRQEEKREGEKRHWPTSAVKCSTMLIPAFNCMLFCLTYQRLLDESR